jgi:hypothetical protein
MKNLLLKVAAALAFSLAPATAWAQNADADLAPPGGIEEAGGTEPGFGNPAPTSVAPPAPVPESTAPANDLTIGQATAADKQRVQSDDVLVAAEGVFGRGAAGLANLIEDILKDQGQPIGYITGKEASAAIGIGAKYGSGTLFHKIEGERKVHWRGPTIGFDAGADANKVFVLVYNLDDGEDLFKAYPAAEGKAYFVGGFTAAYLKRGDVVLIPVRLGAGVRLGANVGYMRFSKKNSWLPF